MSKCTVPWAMLRIAAAAPHSKIAIFRMPGHEQEGLVSAVFESTIMGRARVNSGDAMLIGVYDNEMNPELVESHINEALAVG